MQDWVFRLGPFPINSCHNSWSHLILLREFYSNLDLNSWHSWLYLKKFPWEKSPIFEFASKQLWAITFAVILFQIYILRGTSLMKNSLIWSWKILQSFLVHSLWITFLKKSWWPQNSSRISVTLKFQIDNVILSQIFRQSFDLHQLVGWPWYTKLHLRSTFEKWKDKP